MELQGNLISITIQVIFLFKKRDYDSILLLDDFDTVFLKFDNYKYSLSGKQSIKNYRIEIGKNWFERIILILKIYKN